MNEITTSPGAYNWRAVLPVHPACEIIPAYDKEGLIKLGRNIKAAGRMNVPVIVFLDPVTGTLSLGDGRSRLDAMVMVGIGFTITIAPYEVIITAEGYEIPPAQIIVTDSNFDPFEFVAATNIARRHLGGSERRKVAAKLIIARPDLADRAIGKLAAIDHKTVAVIRAEIQVNGEIPHKTERTEATGRKARGRKPNSTPEQVENNTNNSLVSEQAESAVVGNASVDAETSAAMRKAEDAAAELDEQATSQTTTAKIASVANDTITKPAINTDNRNAKIAELARAGLALLTHATPPNIESARAKLTGILNMADPAPAAKKGVSQLAKAA